MRIKFQLFNKMGGICLIPFIVVGVSSITKAQANMTQSQQKIRITVQGQILTATLNDSKAARDFAELLPLTLTLEDYAGIEKVSDLPKSLSVEGSPSGSEASVGDIAYYAPWGNLAIFYDDFRYSKGLIILGKIEGNIEVLKTAGSIKAHIELFE